MAFLNIRFPDNISYGAMGGPEYSTNVVEVTSGFEQRNQNWSLPRFTADVAHAARTREQNEELIAFFHVAKGKANSFLYKDWADYQCTQDTGVLANIDTGQHQLYKRYSNSAGYQDRKITRPKNGTVTVYSNGSPLTATIDYTTGIVTETAGPFTPISAITKANPGQVTSTSHGLTTGDVIRLSDVEGMTQINGQDVEVTVINANTFTVGIDTTSYSTYTGSGFIIKFAQSGDTLTWAGEFDIPCRFDTDKLTGEQIGHDVFGWSSIPIIEVRE